MIAKLGALPGTYENGETVADVLAYNHFGTETIPPRPVLRMAAEKLAAKFVKARLKAYMLNSLRNPKDAKRLETVFLQDIARQAITEARRIIDSGGELLSNAPSTITKKGFNRPLYETGKLIKCISYEVSE